MNRLFEMRERIQRVYTGYSKYIDKCFQFILALLTFVFINSNIGFMKIASNPVVTLGLAAICAFLPVTITVVFAAILVVIQFYTASVGAAIAVTAIFIVMFILYFRFTPEKAVILLLTPLAFAVRMPMLIPICFGLIGGPIAGIPIALGTIVYFMITYVKTYATTIEGAGKAEMLSQLTVFVKQVFNNKEMWITIIASVLCLLVVYSVRRLSVDNAWKIAIVSGALVDLAVQVIGNVVLHITTPYLFLILGTVLSIVIALILEFFKFSVDYSRTETLQFEDDEYVYYVKAVPKVSVAAPEKTVKRINERQETTSIDVKGVQEQRKNVQSQTEEMLLAKALEDEIDIQKILEEELKL